MSTLITDPTDTGDWAAQTEARLLAAALPLAGRHGWTSRMLAGAAAAVGLSQAEAELLLPRGAQDLAALLSFRHDEAALTLLANTDPQSLKIRERIANGVQARVAAAMADEAAVRRLMGFFALPQNVALGARLSWQSADRIWRWAGDAATDENHYSKRAILAGLLTSTLLVRLANAPADAERHLQLGIDGVMGYEKFKARAGGGLSVPGLAARAAEALGRWRYGTREPAGEPAAEPDATPA